MTRIKYLLLLMFCVSCTFCSEMPWPYALRLSIIEKALAIPSTSALPLATIIESYQEPATIEHWSNKHYAAVTGNSTITLYSRLRNETKKINVPKSNDQCRIQAIQISDDSNYITAFCSDEFELCASHYWYLVAIVFTTYGNTYHEQILETHSYRIAYQTIACMYPSDNSVYCTYKARIPNGRFIMELNKNRALSFIHQRIFTHTLNVTPRHRGAFTPYKNKRKRHDNNAIELVPVSGKQYLCDQSFQINS